MNISIEIQNLPEAYKQLIVNLMSEFNTWGGEMADGKTIVIDYNKLPVIQERGEYMSEMIASAMALHTLQDIK